jgi:hypothetical protein
MVGGDDGAAGGEHRRQTCNALALGADGLGGGIRRSAASPRGWHRQVQPGAEQQRVPRREQRE